jgi:nucleotide-binding universal stress UspA family protein
MPTENQNLTNLSAGRMTILCATDFSAPSLAATRLGAALARRRGDKLLLLYVLEPLPVDPVGAGIASGDWNDATLTDAETQLERQATELRSSGLIVETRLVPGAPSTVILDVARAAETSLIVLGSHGRKAVARFILGSCAERVARFAPCPVLIAREGGADLARWESSVPLRLAVATDGSSATRAVFYWVRTAAPTSPSDVTLLRSYWPPQEGARYGIDDPWQGNEGHPELLKLIERDVRRESEALAGGHLPPLRLRVAGRDAGEEMAADAAEVGAEALVIGIPKQRLGHWTPISPKSVLRAAMRPVFCIPEGLCPSTHHIPRFHSVLIASDLSDLAKEAILPAYGLLSGGGKAHLCYVHEEAEPEGRRTTAVTPRLSAHEREALEAQLQSQIPGEAAEHGIGTYVSVLEGSSVAEEILQAAERLDVDAIALASHGRSGIGRLLLGSVAEEVARKSSRPLLIVHAKAGNGRG